VVLNIPAVFRAALIAGLHVEKRDYSSRPWRIVASDGQELNRWEAHPSPGAPPYETPMAYDRKRDAVAVLMAIREREATR
jgi:hypothetical protein